MGDYIEASKPNASAKEVDEAEKAANIDVLEFRSFGAFGRVYLGGTEEEIAEASKAAISVLESISGRPNN